MKYYGVTSRFYDDGRATAAITSCKECDAAPENQRIPMSRFDFYLDWFSSKEEAEECISEFREENM